LEEITKPQIIGRVISVNGNELPRCSEKLIQLSLAVNKRFCELDLNIEKTIQSEIYALYKKVILSQAEGIMVYQKNTDMDFITVDDTSLTVFNPETGDAHLFDATGIDILNILDEPTDLDEILEKLCAIYDTTAEEIKSDIEQFLAESIEKGAVKAL
jgi:PqqD family protein of HPr-rel-A system